MPSDQSIRSHELVTDEHLLRLARLADAHHRDFAAQHPDWARNRLAACLVQGGARHRIYGDRGVKDVDVYAFYATPPGFNARAFPWNRNTVSVDFGPSEFDRQLYTDEDRADSRLASKIPEWERFTGRRVDLMARAVSAHPGRPLAAVTAWLERGASKRRTRPHKRMSSDWHLARAPVVCLHPECGAVWWAGPDRDEAGIEKGAYS